MTREFSRDYREWRLGRAYVNGTKVYIPFRDIDRDASLQCLQCLLLHTGHPPQSHMLNRYQDPIFKERETTDGEKLVLVKFLTGRARI